MNRPLNGSVPFLFPRSRYHTQQHFRPTFPFPVSCLFECSLKITTFAVESKSSGYEQAISGRSAEL